jgi:hypothetical protein
LQNPTLAEGKRTSDRGLEFLPVIDSEAVQEGGMEVGHRNRFGYIVAFFSSVRDRLGSGLAHHLAAAKGAAGQQPTKAMLPVVATFEHIQFRRAAEFATANHQRRSEQLPTFQFLEQGGKCRIEDPTLL